MTGLLRGVEHHEVLVAVGEVAGIPLVEVVGELSLGIVLSRHAAVLIADAERITVKHDGEDTAGLHGVAGAGLAVHLGSARESEVSAGTLPEGNNLGIGELEVLHIEVVGGVVKINAGRLLELGEHDDVEHLPGSEALLLADVEEGAHGLETVHVEAHDISGVPQERLVGDGLGRVDVLAELLVVHVQEVDGLGAGPPADGTAAVQIVEGVDNHAVDRPHDKPLVLDGHGLVDLVEQHADKCVQFSRTGEAALELAVQNGLVELEGNETIIELSVRRAGLVHEGIVGGPISQFPALVLSGFGHLAGDLHENGAVLPCVHQDRGRETGVGTLNELGAANTVHQGVDELVLPAVDVLDGGANLHRVGKVFGNDGGTAGHFGGDGIHEPMNLFDFHLFFSPSS